MVRDQFICLVVSVQKAVGAQTSFVHDQICDVLGVLNRRARMVDATVVLVALCVHSELNFVDAVTETEDGLERAFNSRHNLFVLVVALRALIVCGDRDEASERL